MNLICHFLNGEPFKITFTLALTHTSQNVKLVTVTPNNGGLFLQHTELSCVHYGTVYTENILYSGNQKILNWSSIFFK